MGGLTDLVGVVNTSSTVNTTQLVGSADGTVIVPTYDWQTFLGEHFHKLVGFKSFHHLRFSSQHQGSVFAKLRSDTPEVEHNLLKRPWTPTATNLPELVTPSGLSLNRQWYLYNKIREFCPDECKGITCPRPAEPEPSSSATTASSALTSASTGRNTTTTSVITTPSTVTVSSSSSPTVSDTSAPPAKRSRLCGICREQGHNARSCPKK